MRKFTKNKRSFTSENTLLKLIYCACQKAMEKWNQPIHNWSLIISQLDVYFDGRLKLAISVYLNLYRSIILKLAFLNGYIALSLLSNSQSSTQG